jgi:hypothetical protein
VIVLTQRMFESPDLPLVHRDIQGAAHAALARVPWTVSMFTAAKAMVVRPVPRLASVTLSVGWDYPEPICALIAVSGLAVQGTPEWSL